MFSYQPERLEERFLLAGTPTLAADLNTDGRSSWPSGFTVFQNAIYYSAYDDEHGRELWKYDGTSATRVTDIDPGPETDFWKARIDTKGASHLYILQNTVIPGGTFGWHSHTGPSLVIVVSGTATEYEGNDPTCTPHLHPAGSTFVDAGEASGHLVRNDSTTDNLVVIVVRLIPEALVPTQRIDSPNPGYCPNIN